MTVVHEKEALLRDVADVRAGHPFRGAVPELPNGNGYVIQPRDVDASALVDWSGLIRADVSGRKRPAWLQQGDVVFSARGGRNLAVAIPKLDAPTVCSQHFLIIDIKQRDEVLPAFVAWQLNQRPLQRYFRQSAEGSLQVSIRRGVLEAAPIAIPPVAVQQQVMAFAAKALGEQKTYERLIELRQLEVDAVAHALMN